MNKKPKFIRILIEGRRGKNAICFERMFDLEAASKVLVTAVNQPSRKQYVKKTNGGI